jgi:hypothetical protein
MLDKDKLYIVAYLGLKSIDDADVPGYIEDVTEHISKGFDDSVKFLVIPTREKETHIEFFNCEMLKNLEPEDAQSLIDKLNEFIKQ